MNCCNLALALLAAPPAFALDLDLARRYLAEAGEYCSLDGGRLWGVSLCGPILLVDPASRAVAANQPGREGRLVENQGLWTGRLPGEQMPANTALDWAGERWTMLLWPLPEHPRRRRALVLHESWHRIQDRIGLPARAAGNEHLDEFEARFWLQLEWRALRAALTGFGERRAQAAGDAVAFRRRRQTLYPKALAEEPALELNEGLAEYTGVRLSADSDSEAAGEAARRLEAAPREASFVRSFAYATGPAYGLLLDAASHGWQRRLTPADDLAELLARAMGLDGAGADVRAGLYGASELRSSEARRETERQARLARYRERLVNGPLLLLPLEKPSASFDPRELLPLPGHGTVYPKLQASDVWGVLEVSQGALLSPDWKQLAVPAPAGPAALSGDGWQLRLRPGWRLVPGARGGDFRLAREP